MSASAKWPTVVVPIHNGATALGACLKSLARTLPPEVPVELVDDASTDPSVTTLMQDSARPGWRSVHQAQNLGFVGTVNAAMARAGGDVVLLNSDTLLTRGWLQRMLACADSNPRIASITPFSNNAEICSVPEFCRANPPPADPEAVALACAQAGPPEYPELPTAVGFCMWLRRAALDQIGDFDAVTFGRGYGEENDWCRRAAGHGWRNVLCDDAYVVHLGGQSFAGTGHAPGGENLARLAARYPGYNALVAQFIERDPLAPRRARIVAQLEALGKAPVRAEN